MPQEGGIALVCGNGLSLSRVAAAGSDLDPRRPLRWNLRTPGRDSRLLDDLPGLKAWLEHHDPGGTRADFADLIIPFTAGLPPHTPIPQELPDEELGAFLDLGHYLAVAYSWFQLDLDRFPMTGWSWLEWCTKHRGRIRAVLSWNYDLAVERLLVRAQLPFTYAGIGSPVFGRKRGVGKRRPAVVAKPHGSCNFAPPPEVQFFSAESDGDEGDPLTYPRMIHLSGYDGQIRVLPDRDLYSIRQVADLVLPGEQNRFRKYLGWVRRSWREFQTAASQATQLVVVGFSMAEADRPEFTVMLAGIPQIARTTVVDPTPNPRLVELLEGMSDVTVVDDIKGA